MAKDEGECQSRNSHTNFWEGWLKTNIRCSFFIHERKRKVGNGHCDGRFFLLGGDILMEELIDCFLKFGSFILVATCN